MYSMEKQVIENIKIEFAHYFFKRFQTIKERLNQERVDWIDEMKRMNPQLTDLEIRLDESKLILINITEAKKMVNEEMVQMGFNGDDIKYLNNKLFN